MARTKSKVSNRNNGKFKNPASLPVSVPRVDLQRLVSFADSPLYKGYEFKPYNPDDLWQKRSNYDLYDKMRIDEQVKAALHLIKYAILGTGWDIVQEDDHRPDILEFVRENLFEQYSGELEDAWWEILSAIDYGFSMTEMVFKLKNGKQWLSELFTIPPHSLDLWTDDKGRIFKIEQDTVHDVDFELPLWKMVYLVNNPEFRNPYGISDLRAAYRAWWSKDNILKFWNIYLERFGTPPIHATFDETAVQRSETSDILDILKSIQQKTEIVTPNSVKLDTIESKRSTTTDYKAAIEEYNLQIAKSLLVPSLSGVVNETKGGSFALGKGQIDLFLLGNEKRRRQFADVINEQLIRKLVIINFGEQESYPEFKFKSLDEQNQLEIVKLWTELTKVGVEIHTEDDSRHIRNILGFPEPQKQVKPPEPKPKEKEEDMTLKFQEFPTIPNPSRPKTKYEKKINFAEVKRTFETHEENLVEELKPVLIKMRDSLIKDVINDTIIERKDFGDARKVEVRHLTEFRKTWDKHLKKMGSEGATEAKKELQKGEEQFQVTTPETLTRKESIDYIKNKSFQITNVESDFINNRVRMTLANAIRDGDSVKDVASEIGKIFDNYGLTEFAEGEKPLGIKPARLNTIARTELADAFNVGQKTIFEASDIVQAYQYSAVLDDRTTEFCAAQDGRIYKTDDPYADLIWPPNHFNCRSLFIPVVEGETFKVNDRLDIEETSPGSKFWRLKK